MVILTQNSTFIIGPVAKILGYIMDFLYRELEGIGFPNIGIAIILFTFVIKLLMMPLTVKQLKFSKMSTVMQPELKEIQKKYKGKERDPQAMQRMQDETKAVYEKYGTSPTGGCVQLLIQMPILFALYRVIQNIPAYVPRLKELFVNMLSIENNGIMSVNGYQEILKNNFTEFSRVENLNNADEIINVLNVFSTNNWNKLIELFPAQAEMIQSNLDTFNNVNSFLTINMSQNPGLVFGLPILIPILAGISQYLSVKVMQMGNPTANDDDNPAAASMKMMNYMMPIMSMVMAISLPAGLGLYWIATAVFQLLQQLVINIYFDKKGMEEVVKENIEKVNKKREKQGLPKQTISNKANFSTKSIENSQSRLDEAIAKKEANDKKMREIIENSDYYKSKNAKPGSLAAKANMVSQFEEKSKGGKK